MNIKNSKIKNNNLQKPLPNTTTIYLFIFLQIVHSFSFFLLCFIKLFLITLNLIRKLYLNFVLKALQEPKSMQETIQQSGVGRMIPKKKKNYLKYNIGMKSRVEIVTNNP